VSNEGSRHYELPEDLQPVMKQAKRLEWLTIAYMFTAVVFLALVLGQSQAMKAAWIEDLLSFLPPAAFLIAARFRERDSSGKFPWGMHRSVSIAYLVAAFALLVMGAYVFLDSAMKLVTAEHPPIGVIPLFGNEIWLGWVMLVALAWSGIPPVILGIRKRKLADQLHDKVLYADAEMNRADWMTAGAASLGVIGIGIGWWWADAVAGALISLDIVHDGVKNVRSATADLMDRMPRTFDSKEEDPIIGELKEDIESLDWVEGARVRVRDMGHVYAGEAFVVPVDGEDQDLIEHASCCRRELLDKHWKLHDIVIVLVEPDEAERDPSPHDRSGTEQSPSAR
jgi:cation diffusion facilitator family transporter